MAEKALVAKKPVAKPKEEFASKSEVSKISASVDSLAESMGMLMEMVKAQATQPVAPIAPTVETPLDKEIRKAGPRREQVNPEWEEKAKEILGDYFDHCEVEYLKHGGTVFTLVINAEKSNAPAEYLHLYKTDRRSKEIGNEGIEGVESWCKLVMQNLKRPTR